MKAAFFWIAWGVISFWVLKTFYFSYDKNKFNNLRKTAFGINLSVLILFFLPWIPQLQGGLTGWELILQGNTLVILLGILIVFSTLAFFAKDKMFLKAGSISHITASILLILIMINLVPGTFTLTFQSIAPILASMLLLAGDVVVLLLWQQLQLKGEKRR